MLESILELIVNAGKLDNVDTIFLVPVSFGRSYCPGPIISPMRNNDYQLAYKYLKASLKFKSAPYFS